MVSRIEYNHTRSTAFSSSSAQQSVISKNTNLSLIATSWALMPSVCTGDDQSMLKNEIRLNDLVVPHGFRYRIYMVSFKRSKHIARWCKILSEQLIRRIAAGVEKLWVRLWVRMGHAEASISLHVMKRENAPRSSITEDQNIPVFIQYQYEQLRALCQNLGNSCIKYI